MPTYIDGIGASENLDSSGERIIIAGLDISSLDKDGIFNYEHKSDQPSQIVGKVLKARKIFSDKDCEDDRQSYYWQKVQVPFLYVMGELFDDYKDSAKDVAGMFRYDAAKRGQNERNVMNFSVEGAKISKEGMDITRSIARKITITVLPCNKMAIAEIVPAAGAKPKDDLDSIFKTESHVEVELLKFEDPMALLDMLKKREGPDKHAAKLGIKPMKKENGLAIGGASTALSGVGPSSSNGVSGGEGMMRSEMKKGPVHRTGTGVTVIDENGKKLPKIPGTSRGAFEAPKSILPPKPNMKPMKKALDAGSGNAAPGALSGGAVLGKESLSSKKANVTTKKKSQWLARAEQEYQSWEKREQFEQFMAKRMPHLKRGEIQAIGQTIALSKAVKAEKVLKKISDAQNYQHSYVAKKENK